MLAVLLSTAIAGTMTTPPPALACETSARYEQLDESTLDLAASPGTSPIQVTIGCRFGGVPGAVLDVGSGADMVRGLTVLGIRRATGEVIVQATSAQADRLRGHAEPLAPTVVQDGDWRPLIAAMERLGR